MKAQPWVWPVVVGLLVAPGAALGWHEVGAPMGLGAAANLAGFVLASPVAVLAAGFVAENVLVQPLIAPSSLWQDWAFSSRRRRRGTPGPSSSAC
jgi:hypothetical protein